MDLADADIQLQHTQSSALMILSKQLAPHNEITLTSSLLREYRQIVVTQVIGNVNDDLFLMHPQVCQQLPELAAECVSLQGQILSCQAWPLRISTSHQLLWMEIDEQLTQTRQQVWHAAQLLDIV